MTKTKTDVVNHPPYYTAGKFEVIDIIEDAVSRAPDPINGGLQWQTLKYILRMWSKGDPATDAQKARWYLDRLIANIGRKQA